MSLETPQPHFIQLHQHDQQAVRAELLTGLAQMPARVAPKFFYDALGSRLFDAITELAEYYPTRTEALIFSQRGGDMARCIAPGSVLIDLGAGSCAKAARLFAPLQPAACARSRQRRACTTVPRPSPAPRAREQRPARRSSDPGRQPEVSTSSIASL